MSDKRPDPNATIQIDLSQIQLEDIVVPSAAPQDAPASAVPRSLPPPLPPVLPIVSVPREPAKGKKVALIGLFALLLVAAIAAGLMVGARVRGTPATDGAPPVAS